MGLIYIPNDANQVETQLTSDLQMSRTFLNRLKMATTHLTTVVGGGKLDGKAYRKGLGLMQDCVLPTIKHTTSAIDGIAQDLVAFTSAKSYMPNEPIYEDKLVAQISVLQSQKSAQEALSAVYQHHILSLVAGPIGVAIDLTISQFTDAKQQLDNWGNSVDEEIRKTQEKLDKLRQFNAQTSHLFQDSLSKLKLAMQGVEALNGSRINSDGSYRLASGMDKSWFRKVQKTEPSQDNFKKIAKQLGIPFDDFMTLYELQKKVSKTTGIKYMKGIITLMKPGNLSEKQFALFGKHGQKTFNYLMQDWRETKKFLRTLDNPAARKMLSAMDGSFNQFLKKVEKLKDFKGIAKYTKPLSKYVGWGTDFVKKGVVTTSTKLSKLKPLGKIAGKAGWVAMIATAGVDGYASYHDKTSAGYKNLGKAAVHAGVNQLKSAGPIEGGTNWSCSWWVGWCRIRICCREY